MLFFLSGNFDLIQFICFIVVAFFAFAYHELGHALVANYLGDPTPRQHGRMTLNPFPHISPVGMIMLILIGFGWAVTPINPQMMRGNPRTAHAIVAIAGPAFNLIMAVLFAIPIRIIMVGAGFGFSPLAALPEQTANIIMTFLFIGVNLNLFLIGFNLLPIPPLDGFWVLRGLLPPEMAYQMDRLLPYGMMIFLLVIFILPRLGIDVFGLIRGITTPIFYLLTGF
ncbi:MAG: site-2 protease family protein [Anaerolineae bacterium]|nr:site-2 protease family protein [Anaerolineae bacterium]